MTIWRAIGSARAKSRPGEQLAEVQAVVHILCTLWRGASMQSASMWAACWSSRTTVCSGRRSTTPASRTTAIASAWATTWPWPRWTGPTSDPEDFTDYLQGFLAAVGVPTVDQSRAHDLLARVLRTPVWCQPVPGSRAGLRALARRGRAPGRDVEQRRHGGRSPRPSRVGAGGRRPGDVPWRWSPTRGSSASASPIRACSRPRSTRSTWRPERILHIGDSVHYDVDGGAAVGMQTVHMDPFERVRVDRPPPRADPRRAARSRLSAFGLPSAHGTVMPMST